MAVRPLLPVLLLWCSTIVSGVPRRCGPVPQVPNATPTGDDNSVGSKIPYTCDPGYIHTGTRKANKCRNDLTWTNNVVCTLNRGCSQPQPPEHAYFVDLPEQQDRKHAVGTEATLKCSRGFYLEGRNRITCTPNYQWTTTNAACIPTGCGNPGDLWNGGKDSYLTTVGTRVNFYCDPGYTLRGSPYRICLADGTWTGTEPSCNINCCSRVVRPDHSSVSTFDNCYKDKVTITCDSGYVTEDTRQETTTITCKENGEWDAPMPVCQELQCQPMYLPNGHIKYTGYSFASYIIFSCLENTTPEGEMLGQCQENGEWTVPPPKCYAHCTEFQLENGNNRDKDESELGYVPHRTETRLHCFSDYQVKFVLSQPYYQSVHCNNGSWEGSTATCIPAPCNIKWHDAVGRMYHVDQEKVAVGTNVDSNKTVEATCIYGYEGEQYTIHCSHGYWTPRISPPSCSKMRCQLPEFKGTKYTDTFNNEISRGYMEFGDTVSIKCSLGFRNTRNVWQSQCDAGYFSPQIEPCEQVFCYPPNLEHAYLEPSKDKYEHDTENYVSIRCRYGFRPEKNTPTSTYCNDGSWTRVPMDCTDRCDIPQVEGVVYEVDGEQPIGTLSNGASMNVTCKSSYKPGPDFRHKVSCIRGQLEPLPKPCQSMHCNKPYTGQYTSLVPDKYEYEHNEEVNITCADGYALPQGASYNAVCNDRELYITHCKPAPCEVPQHNGTTYEYYRGTPYTRRWVDSFKTLLVICKDGYTRQGQNYITCEYGRFTSNNLVCSKEKCSLQYYPETIYRKNGQDIESAEQGDVIQISCSPGFFNPVNETRCDANSLTPEVGPCEPVQPLTTIQPYTEESYDNNEDEGLTTSTSSNEIGSGNNIFTTTPAESNAGGSNEGSSDGGTGSQRACQRLSSGSVEFRYGGWAVHGTEERFSCNNGWVAKGLDPELIEDYNYVRCIDGTWQPTPSCRDPEAPAEPYTTPRDNGQQGYTGPTTPSEPTVAPTASTSQGTGGIGSRRSCPRTSSGKVEFRFSGEARHDAEERFTCKDGFIAKGLEVDLKEDYNYARCVDGTWQPTPKCIAPPCNAQDTLSVTFEKTGSIDHGESVVFSCGEDKQTPDGKDSDMTTCKEGKFDPEPRCNQVGCDRGMAKYGWSYCKDEASTGWLYLSVRGCIDTCAATQCDGFEYSEGYCRLYPKCDKGRWNLTRYHYTVYLKVSWCA